MSTALGGSLAKAQTSTGASPTTNFGPENKPLSATQEDIFMPPSSDQGEVKPFWSSFSLARRRIQEGGWSRQVTAETFPISTGFAGVNMRLTAGGVRELHWHAATEWAILLNGSARLTAIDNEGRSYVQDVNKNDLWYFPAGIPHSIQGLGPDGCEFLLVFDDGNFSEENTTLISDWLRHTPPEVLSKNWSLPEKALKPITKLPKEGKFIFQAAVPGPLEADRQAAAGSKERSPVAFEFRMSQMEPTKRVALGEVRVVDSTVFPISKRIIMAHVVIKPGGLRELHWHQNSDEWQYYVAGKGRMTVFENGSRARTMDFAQGDVGFVKHTKGHYIENTGDTELVYLEIFLADRFQDLSLNEWVTHTPPELVMQHLEISPEILATIPKEKLIILPSNSGSGSSGTKLSGE